MSALIELYAPNDSEFTDSLTHIWEDGSYHAYSTIQAVIRASSEGIAGERYWPPYILEMDTIQYRPANYQGGHSAISFGNITFSLKTFDEDSLWPPPKSFSFNLFSANNGSDIGKNRITSGMMHLSRITDQGIAYEVYGEKYEVNILDEAILYREDSDYSEAEEQPVPLALGEIEHRQAVRLPDAVGGNFVYHKAGMDGVNGTDWHVYDDGVLIDANVANETDTQFELTASPVGEVTISGVGKIVTLADFVDYGRQRLGLSLNTANARAPSPELSFYLTGQQTVLQALDAICSVHTHLFWINISTLNLIDMLTYTDTIIIENANKVIDSSYSMQTAISAFVAEWDERYPVEITAGKMIREREKKYTVFTQLFYGDEQSIVPYQSSDTAIKLTLQNIRAIYLRNQGEVALPLTGPIPVPGTRYMIEDTTLLRNTNVEFFVRGVAYNFIDDKLVLQGDCVLT